MPMPRFLVLATALALLSAPPPAHATQVLQQSLRDLTLGSQDIVIGRVEDTQVRWNEAHTKIVTDVTVRVDESLKGASAERLTLTQLGGDLDGFRYSVPGSPLFRAGEQALLFVWRDARGRAQVNGLAQGKFDITTDPATGARTVQRSGPGMQVRELGALSPVRPGQPVPRLALTELVGEIRRILEEGGR